MSVNSGKGQRVGSQKEMSQVFNNSTGHWIKRDTSTGQFIDVNRSGEPFKGVRKEPSTKIKTHPLVSKKLALKAEKAVLSLNKLVK